MPGGRPPIPFDEELADEVLERIATTEMGLEQVLAERAEQGKSVVGHTTWYKWIQAHPQFADKSVRARRMQAELLHDRAQVAAREPLIGKIESVRETKDGTFAESRIVDNVERSKLIVQTLLKRAGQLDSGRYGDKLDVNHGVQTDKLGELKAALSAGAMPFGSTNEGIPEDASED